MRSYFLAAVLAFGLISPAFAGTVTVSWINPTRFTDGTTLAPTAIQSTRVEYGSCSGTAFGTKQGEFSVTGAVSSATSPNLAAGTYCFRAFTRAAGVESAASNVASKVVTQPAPEAPVLTTMDTAAYRIEQTKDNIRLVRIGTLPLKTLCSESDSVNGMHVVPRDKVKLTSGSRPPVILAKCGYSL